MDKLLISFYAVLAVLMIVFPTFRRCVFHQMYLNFVRVRNIGEFVLWLVIPGYRRSSAPKPQGWPLQGRDGATGQQRKSVLPRERVTSELARMRFSLPQRVAEVGLQVMPEGRLAALPEVVPEPVPEPVTQPEPERLENYRPRTPHELLMETLAVLENERSFVLRDEAVWLLGFPNLCVDRLLEGKPNLQKHLPVEACGSRREALLRCSRERNREDLVGRVAELLIKMHSS